MLWRRSANVDKLSMSQATSLFVRHVAYDDLKSVVLYVLEWLWLFFRKACVPGLTGVLQDRSDISLEAIQQILSRDSSALHFFSNHKCFTAFDVMVLTWSSHLSPVLIITPCSSHGEANWLSSKWCHRLLTESSNNHLFCFLTIDVHVVDLRLIHQCIDCTLHSCCSIFYSISVQVVSSRYLCMKQEQQCSVICTLFLGKWDECGKHIQMQVINKNDKDKRSKPGVLWHASTKFYPIWKTLEISYTVGVCKETMSPSIQWNL